MEWSKLTDPEAVRQAIAEFDRLGRDQFLNKYGYGIARAHFLRVGGKYYDSKAIAGAAYGYQHPEEGALRNEQFSGGDATVKRRLNALGFAVTDAPPTTADELRERLAAIKAYQRENYTAPHKAVVLLIALHRFANDQTSTWTVADLDDATTQLLAELEARTDGSLEPIWRLQADGLAEITNNSTHLLDEHPSSDPPTAAALLAGNVTWSFPSPVANLLSATPGLADSLISDVYDQLSDDHRQACEEWFADHVTIDETANGVRSWGRQPRGWVIRAYRTKENADYCLTNGLACVSFHQVPDLEGAATRDAVQALVDAEYGDKNEGARRNFATQLDRLRNQVAVGDVIVLPHLDDTGSRQFAIGICTGGYHFAADEPHESNLKHRIKVDWKLRDIQPDEFKSLARFLNAPLTVQPLDDDLTQRLEQLLEHGTINLTWWVNQGHSLDFEHAATCICAPRKTTKGHVLRYWADVGRVLTGDTIIHYSKGHVVAVSQALTDGTEGRRPYGPDGDMDGWLPEVYIARCTYDTLWDEIPLTEIEGRTTDVGPFTSSGGVKQGYFWPVSHDFVSTFAEHHAEQLRGTVLNPGNIWLFQANPTAEHTQFPQRLQEVAETTDAANWGDTWSVTRFAKDMQRGDRVMFWFSGKDAGIYASGLLLSEPYDADEDPITGSRTQVDVWIDLNHARQPLLKDALRDDPELGDLHVISVPNGTNFKATQTNWDAYLNHVATTPYDTARPEKPEDVMRLADLTNQLYLSPTDTLDNIVELFRDRPQAIFYGPPGTGKTYVARQLADHLTANGGATKLVQFHPSYAYEDFVEGWRPTPNGQFELRDGALKTFADDASRNPDHRYVMVIDEINRANLSKVLGELFFLLEYRDETANLQYSDSAFSLPKNLWIIGTMNTADRSIAMVDAALRRRFHFHAFFPTEQPIDGTLRRFLADHHPSLTWVADMVDKANEQLPDRNLGIGPSHFMRPNLTEQLIQRIWTHSILPYIEDNFDYDKNALQPFTYNALR